MFTLKFYNHCKNTGNEISHVVCAPHYEVTKRKDKSVEVTIYKDYTSEKSGVSYRVSSYPKDFSTCYIENIAGKTIESYIR